MTYVTQISINMII